MDGLMNCLSFFVVRSDLEFQLHHSVMLIFVLQIKTVIVSYKSGGTSLNLNFWTTFSSFQLWFFQNYILLTKEASINNGNES